MSALPSRLILPAEQPVSTARAPGLIRPTETLLRLDRSLLRPGFDINDYLMRHGIEPTASIVTCLLMAGGVLAPAVTAFSATGADQAYTVPWGVYLLRLDLWGAAGAAGAQGGNGGPGGYTTGLLAVTPGELLTVIAGKPGVNTPGVSSYGGGGATRGLGSSGSGGGRSAVRRASGTEVATAGGGGGASNNYSGGAGGGASGGDTGGGKGGTQSAGGGAGGSNGTAGGQYAGGMGESSQNSGGGGGGWFGGGGGSGDGTLSTSPGGGGSGYIGGLTAATTTVGSGITPAGTSSANYAPGIGVGASSPLGAAGAGRVVITTVP